ncbi:phage Gp37/Gp68 family protein [Paraburkholderia aspalathi]|uniref:phage Gp37/Gp68 family protein n=1 Tax=Paraburkholderia aspalathi TaxID=1324617 RepID=UPI0038BBBC8C
MSENSSIEWTDNTFNPFIGCTKVSPGCDNCYAEQMMDTRLHRVRWGAGQPRVRTSAANWREPLRWNARHAEFFARHGRCERVFCASLADVFDNEVPVAWRVDLLDLIRRTPRLDWLVLTKRVGNVMRMLQEVHDEGLRTPVTDDDRATKQWLRAWLDGSPPVNVWLGATIVNQEEANRDIPKLLSVPARVLFLSMEPLLGPVSLRWLAAWPENAPGTTAQKPGGLTNHLDGLRRLDWVIVGGESGHSARPMHPDWPRALRDQCAHAGVAFLYKQHGEWAPAPWKLERETGETDDAYKARSEAGAATHGISPTGTLSEFSHRPWSVERATEATPGWAAIRRAGKKAAGRMLDGVTHDEFPT